MAKKSKKRSSKQPSRKFGGTVHLNFLKRDYHSTIEELWAEAGLVHVKEIDGRTTTIKPEIAVRRLQALNAQSRPLMNPEQQRSFDDLMDRAIPVIRKALHQRENKNQASREHQAIMNLVQTGTASGRPLEDVIDLSMEGRVQQYLLQFFTLDEGDVRSILKEKSMPERKQEALMFSIHQDRLDRAHGIVT